MIKIRNKETGEIMEVEESQLGEYGITPMQQPQQPTTGDMNIAPEQAMLAQILFPGKQGGDAIKSAYEIQRQAQLDEHSMGESLRKERAKLTDLEHSMYVLEKNYDQLFKQGRGPIRGRSALLLSGITGGTLFPETADYEALRKGLIGPVARAISGEVGVLTDRDIKRAEDMLPKVSDAPKVAERKLNNLKELVALKKGEEFTSEDKKKDSAIEGQIVDNPLFKTLDAFSRYGERAQQGTDEIMRGMMQLPDVLAQAGEEGPMGSLRMLKDMGVGYGQNLLDIASNPGEAITQRPTETFLDLMPFLQAGRMRMAGQAGKAGKAEKIASLVPDETKAIAPPAEPLAPQIQRIIDKSAKVDETRGVSQVSRNVYQSVLNISKKNNAFERLKPNETVATMIEHGISGTPDQIISKTQKVTGKNGILSNVVNEAVSDVKVPTNINDMGRIYRVVSDSKKGMYGWLNDADYRQVVKQLNDFPQGKSPGQVEVSKLLDFERKLQAEAQMHRINGLKGDVRSKELAHFKSSVAEEIASVIDEKAAQSQVLSKYKNPAIIKEIEKISPKLAEEFKNTKSIQEIRSLQRDYVRMSMIMELAMQESSSLGKNLFRAGSQIPVVGPVLDSVAQQVAVPVATKSAIGMEKLMQSNPYMKKIFGN
jgi:hypothetical protein